MIHTGKRRITVDIQNLAINRCIELQGYSALGNEPTQTIDLQSLLTYDAGKSGVFDLTDITSTSLGKLLNALPVPVLLVDQWFCIAFVNQACEKLRVNSKALKGSRFTDLLPNPDDAARAKTLESKTMVLLERTFSDRKPQKAEAILEIEKHRIWSRLHLRSVRLSSARYIMVIIEDVTYERAKQRMSQKGEKELKDALAELEHRVEQISRELSETEQNLILERIQHEVTKKQLSVYLENEKSNE
jgi:nitrogen-specific signal transduction histidine kinase